MAAVAAVDGNTTTTVAETDLLDNNLPLGVNFPSKLARINSECSDPSLQADCVPGQKWKCINEEGRWRKHKCKFHVSGDGNCSLVRREEEEDDSNAK